MLERPGGKTSKFPHLFLDRGKPGCIAVNAKGQRFGTIESVKSVSDLYAPVSGRVIGVNAALKDAPELVNTDPYAGGWMVDLEPTDKTEVDELLGPDAYTAHVAAQ